MTAQPDPAALRGLVEKASAAWLAFVAARVAMNSARPGIRSTRAEHVLYDELYRADHDAEREHQSTAIRLGQHASEILALLDERAADKARIAHDASVIEGLNKQLTEQFALSTKYVALAERYREALTPSGDTKAAYIGEFHMGITLRHRGQEDYRRVPIEWTTTKEIMAAISARATRSALGGEGAE